MTRKDYPFLAAVLKQVRDGYAPHWDPNLFRACDDHAKQLADALKAENQAFDSVRFLKAAGVKTP